MSVRWSMICMLLGSALIAVGLSIILWNWFLLLPLLSRWLIGSGILVMFIGGIGGLYEG